MSAPPSYRSGPRWAGLLVGSGALVLGLDRLGLPGALLLGPMAAGIACACLGMAVRVPRRAFLSAQGLVGCLIAHSVTGELLRDVARNWPAMVLAVLGTVLASAAVGWVLARFSGLPGTSAAWGSSPGAAAAMVAMSEQFGADIRLVALMQYLRVICVVAVAALVTRSIGGHGDAAASLQPHPIPPVASPIWLAGTILTVAVAVAGSWLGTRVRIPAGGLLVPLLAGAVLNAAGPIELVLPQPLLVFAYGAIGWFIGLQFDRATVLRSVRLLPVLLLATLAVIALCAGSSWLLVRLQGTDPLTAFLATTPGGIDSVAILAVGGNADAGFVLALQTLRLVVVVATGPWIARFIARTTSRS